MPWSCGTSDGCLDVGKVLYTVGRGIEILNPPIVRENSRRTTLGEKTRKSGVGRVLTLCLPFIDHSYCFLSLMESVSLFVTTSLLPVTTNNNLVPIRRLATGSARRGVLLRVRGYWKNKCL